MVKYVLKRIALMFFVFFTILTVCFVLVKLLPLVDAKQFGKDMNLIQQRREALGYNKPILIQYLIFLKRSVLGGDWGISEAPVSYTHLTLPTIPRWCRSRWSPYH